MEEDKMAESTDGPLGSLQVVVGLLQLPHVFVELLLDAARLAEVVLQRGDLLVALGVLVLQLLLKKKKKKKRQTTDDLQKELRFSSAPPPHAHIRLQLVHLSAFPQFFLHSTVGGGSDA